MRDIPTLTPAQQRFIESLGLYFEQYQVSRIGGRLLGLLALLDGPLTLDQMAGALGVSRASVSTNIRVLVNLGIAEHISLPGDRRDYYHFADNSWQRGMEARITGTTALRRIGELGLASVEPDNAIGRRNLEELIDFCDFMIEDMRGMIARWQARRALNSRHLIPPPPRPPPSPDTTRHHQPTTPGGSTTWSASSPPRP